MRQVHTTYSVDNWVRTLGSALGMQVWPGLLSGGQRSTYPEPTCDAQPGLGRAGCQVLTPHRVRWTHRHCCWPDPLTLPFLALADTSWRGASRVRSADVLTLGLCLLLLLCSLREVMEGVRTCAGWGFVSAHEGALVIVHACLALLGFGTGLKTLQCRREPPASCLLLRSLGVCQTLFGVHSMF